jgi:hypothetical protein
MIRLIAVPGADGEWNVSRDGSTPGKWQRTAEGATFSDRTGARPVTRPAAREQLDSTGGGEPGDVLEAEASDWRPGADLDAGRDMFRGAVQG